MSRLMHASKIDDAELRRLHQSGTMHTATTVARKFAGAARGLTPNDVLALALHLHPKDAPADALARLDATVDDFIRTFSAVSSQLREALTADHERLAPIVAKAARRRHEGMSEIAAIDSRIAAIKRHDSAKRERLKHAGLSEAEVHTVGTPSDTSALSERRAALVAEAEALDRFLRTREAGELPADFAENAPLNATYKPQNSHERQ